MKRNNYRKLKGKIEKWHQKKVVNNKTNNNRIDRKLSKSIMLFKIKINEYHLKTNHQKTYNYN